MSKVPSMISSREPHQSLSVLSPDSEPEDDLVMTKMSVIVDRENSLGLNSIIGQEPVVETVDLRSDDMYGDTDVRPLEVGRRRPRTVPDHDDLVEVWEAVQPRQGVHQHLLPLVGQHDHGELLLGHVTPQSLAELVARTSLTSIDGSEPEAGSVELSLCRQNWFPRSVRRQEAGGENCVPGMSSLGQNHGVVSLKTGRRVWRFQGSL